MPDNMHTSIDRPTPENSVENSNQPLRARVDALFSEMRLAVQVAEERYRESTAALGQNLESKIQSGDENLNQKVQDDKNLLLAKIDALAVVTQQYQEQQQYALEVASTERRASAEALREEQRRALEQADSEREKSAIALRAQYERAAIQADAEREKAAAALRDALAREIQSGDSNLRLHIEAQISQVESTILSGRELVESAFAASEKAIAKAESANEKRFEQVNDFRVQWNEQIQNFVPRELFDQAQAENRRRGDAMTQLIQNNATNITEMQARGGGEKDQAADVKSTLAIGVAVISALVAAASGIISALA